MASRFLLPLRSVVPALLAGALVPVAAWAAEPAHCYRDPPPEALPGKTPNPFLFIDYAFGPTIAWRTCGYDMTRHAEVWRGFYESHGCSAQSDAGRMFEQLLSGSAPRWNENSLQRARTEAPALFARWCDAWVGFEMPDYSEVGIDGNGGGEQEDEARKREVILEKTDVIAKQIGVKLGLRK